MVIDKTISSKWEMGEYYHYLSVDYKGLFKIWLQLDAKSGKVYFYAHYCIFKYG